MSAVIALLLIAGIAAAIVVARKGSSGASRSSGSVAAVAAAPSAAPPVRSPPPPAGKVAEQSTSASKPPPPPSATQAAMPPPPSPSQPAKPPPSPPTSWPPAQPPPPPPKPASPPPPVVVRPPPPPPTTYDSSYTALGTTNNVPPAPGRWTWLAGWLAGCAAAPKHDRQPGSTNLPFLPSCPTSQVSSRWLSIHPTRGPASCAMTRTGFATVRCYADLQGAGRGASKGASPAAGIACRSDAPTVPPTASPCRWHDRGGGCDRHQPAEAHAQSHTNGGVRLCRHAADCKLAGASLWPTRQCLTNSCESTYMLLPNRLLGSRVPGARLPTPSQPQLPSHALSHLRPFRWPGHTQSSAGWRPLPSCVRALASQAAQAMDVSRPPLCTNGVPCLVSLV